MNDTYISPEYLAEQKWLHAQPKGYGGKGDKWAEVVRGLAEKVGANSVLDYGCGRGSLGRALAKERFGFFEYDPAIKGKQKLPQPADLVVTTDVLEHVEPDKIVAVLDHLTSLTKKGLFAVAATGPAVKVLSDGRNAHILIRDAQWWHDQFSSRFVSIEIIHCRFHKEWAALMTNPRKHA